MVCLSVVTKVKPGKEIEFAQSMDTLKADEEARPSGGRVMIRQDVREPSRHTIVLEWENDQDFERYLNSEGVVFLRGSLIVLCGESRFSITPRSPKHDRLRADYFNLLRPRPQAQGR
jgi:hypothetical protein